MIFNLHNFVMKTLEEMSKHYAEFQVREFALNWYAKGTLTDEDMMAIESWYVIPESVEETFESDEPFVPVDETVPVETDFME